jgi:TPR repeat protein
MRLAGNVAKAGRWWAVEIPILGVATSLARVLFEEGKVEEAIRYLEIDAARGHSPAIYRLGLIYSDGQGVPADLTRAYRYFEQATDMGHLFAKRALLGRALRGELGLLSIPAALLELVRDGFRVVSLANRDIYDVRLHGW